MSAPRLLSPHEILLGEFHRFRDTGVAMAGRAWRRLSAPCRLRVTSATLYVFFVTLAALLVSCGQSAERSAVDELMTPAFRGELVYLDSDDFVEPDLPVGESHTLETEKFIDSLMPFLVYAEFGIGFDSGEDEALQFDEWMRHHIFVTDNHPSGYLLTLMWTMIAPPSEFEKLVWERELSNNRLTDWDPEHFSDRYRVYLYELARAWLDINSERRPTWLKIE